MTERELKEIEAFIESADQYPSRLPPMARGHMQRLVAEVRRLKAIIQDAPTGDVNDEAT